MLKKMLRYLCKHFTPCSSGYSPYSLVAFGQVITYWQAITTNTNDYLIALVTTCD